MDKDQFGKHVWTSLHALAGWCFTQQQRYEFVNMVDSLQKLFPCPFCAKHLKQTLEEYPILNYTGSAEDLLRWTWIAHNEANKHFNKSYENRGKPRKYSLTWEKVKEMYLGEDDEETPPHRTAYINTKFK